MRKENISRTKKNREKRRNLWNLFYGRTEPEKKTFYQFFFWWDDQKVFFHPRIFSTSIFIPSPSPRRADSYRNIIIENINLNWMIANLCNKPVSFSNLNYGKDLWVYISNFSQFRQSNNKLWQVWSILIYVFNYMVFI